MKLDLDTIEKRIDEYHERKSEKPRSHLGASTLGETCERKMWYQFHWAKIERFSGRMLRLFRRGQNEEPIMAADLRAIGMDLRFTGDDQLRVYFGSHVSGSMDGIIFSGVPVAPEKKHLWENKTHSKKSFTELAKRGVKEAKPEHWVQMMVYMEGTHSPEFIEKNGFGNVDRAIYTAVNKDDDELYTERVKLDREVARKYIERGKRVALSPRLPAPNPSFHCNWCPMAAMCKELVPTQEVNCRTCAHSTSKEDSTWYCERHEGKIPLENQYAGCSSHVLHPDLVPWAPVDGDGVSAEWEDIGWNGERGKTSKEILAKWNSDHTSD